MNDVFAVRKKGISWGKERLQQWMEEEKWAFWRNGMRSSERVW